MSKTNNHAGMPSPVSGV